MMNMKLAVVLLSAFFIVQAEYQPGPKARQCAEEADVDEATLKHLVTSDEAIAENDKNDKLFQCIYLEYINDSNRLLVNDKLTAHTENVFTDLLGGKREIGVKLAGDALKECKDFKGNAKGTTAIRVVNCLKTKLADYKKTV